MDHYAKLTTSTKTDGKVSYATTSANINLMPLTIRDRLNMMAEKDPHRVIYVFPHNNHLELCYLDLQQRAQMLAQNLLAMGFEKGQRLALALPNTHELLIAYFAAAYIGLIVVTLNPEYGLEELQYMLDKTRPTGFLIYDYGEYHKIITELFPEITQESTNKHQRTKSPHEESARFPGLKHIIVANAINNERKYDGAWCYEHLAFARISEETHEFPYIDLDDPWGIIFTSGTTDKPKGVVVRQSALLNNSLMFGQLPGDPDWAQNCCNTYLMYYAGNISMGSMMALCTGKKIVFPSYRHEAEDILASIQRYKCNTLIGMPKLLIDLLDNPLSKKYDLSSLRYVGSASQFVSPRLINRMRKEWHIEKFIIRFAMTETGMISMSCIDSLNMHDSQSYRSVGRPVPHFECKIVDPVTNAIMPVNGHGELLVRGFSVMKGYWQDPIKTAQTIDDNGWLRTGDVMYMDRDGYLYFCSRLKEVISRDGYKIYAAEVEQCLNGHPSILESVVFGLDSLDDGSTTQQEICAWVRLGDDIDETLISPLSIQEYCETVIDLHKVPGYIKFVKSFPIKRGKYLRNEMQALYRAELLCNRKVELVNPQLPIEM